MPRVLDPLVAACARALGEKLRKARKAKELTQRWLANADETDVANLRRYEKGEVNVTIEMLVKLAEALDLKLQIEFVPKDDAAPSPERSA